MIVLALLVLVGLLLQLQTCSPFTGGDAAKKPAASKRASKPPALIPPQPGQATLKQAETKFVDQRQREVARIDHLQYETMQAYAHMDGRKAALILNEMDPTVAMEILAHLKERDIARILEETEPAKAAEWTAELLKRPEFTPVPDMLKKAAAKAGLYDNLPDLLNEAGATQDASAAGADATGAADTTGAAGDSTNTTQQPPAEGAGASGTPGATPAPGSTAASPAGNPPPANGGATAEPPAAGSQA